MAKAGPRKIARYGDRFKATAVKLSSLPGVLIKDVAEALDVHPFMLSLWRKQVRAGSGAGPGDRGAAQHCVSRLMEIASPDAYNRPGPV